MSSSTWRVLSGYATYQRSPIRITSGGKCAPLKLIAIVSLPHEVSLVMEGNHTANGLKENLRQNPSDACQGYTALVRGRAFWHGASRRLSVTAVRCRGRLLLGAGEMPERQY